MPPPKSHKKLTAAQKEMLKRWVAEGAEYQPHWSFIPPTRPAVAGGEGRGVGPQPDRRVRPGRAGEARPEAGPGGRPPHPGPPAEPRPDRPAADAGGRRGVRQRQVAGRLREVRRQAAGLAALGRAPRPLLARRRPLRRHARHPLRQLPRDLGLPRLGHQRVQQQPAVRPVHHRAARRRPAAEPDARPADRHRVQPLQHHDQRGRRHRRGVPRPLHPRPHRDGRRRCGWG